MFKERGGLFGALKLMLYDQNILVDLFAVEIKRSVVV